MNTIKIPATVDQAVNTLGGLGELIIARKWERAAIVAAFVRLAPGRGKRNTTSGISPAEFADLDIIGLRSTTSVTKYVQAWLDTHDGEYPEPGARVELPDAEFPPMRTGTDGFDSDEGLRNTLRNLEHKHGPDKVAGALIDETPATAKNARTKLRQRDEDELAATTKQRTGSEGGFKPTAGERELERAQQYHRWMADASAYLDSICDAADDGLLDEGTARQIVDGIYAERFDRFTALRFDLAGRYAKADR